MDIETEVRRYTLSSWRTFCDEFPAPFSGILFALGVGYMKKVLMANKLAAQRAEPMPVIDLARPSGVQNVWAPVRSAPSHQSSGEASPKIAAQQKTPINLVPQVQTPPGKNYQGRNRFRNLELE